MAPELSSYITDLPLYHDEEGHYLLQENSEEMQQALEVDHDAFSVVIGSRSRDSMDAGNDGYCTKNGSITIGNLSVSAYGDKLLKNTSLKMYAGRAKRYGLVGANGTGKSTLLKLLAVKKIPLPRNMDVLLVDDQEAVGDDKTAVESVVSAKEKLVNLRKEVADLRTSNVGNDDVARKRLKKLCADLKFMGSDGAEDKASKILEGLGFTREMQDLPTNTLSVGWRVRLSLARALFVNPTLLLLDDPTKHLDLNAVLWLEEHFNSYTYTHKAVVVVSHDRDFLNTVCNHFIHLHDQKLRLYSCNFDAFEKNRIHAIERAEIYIKRIDGAPKKRNDDYIVRFEFPEPAEINTPALLKLEEVSFSYPNRNDFKLSNVNISIDMGTRVAIVGSSGGGKSTLLKLISGDLVPDFGELWRSHKLRIGRYSQHMVDLLTTEASPIEYILHLHLDQEGPSKEEAIRARLEKFGLPARYHHTHIAKLSEKHKARVVFTSIYMSMPHILVLDEPTSHLDMESIDALAEALETFKGGVVLLSNDSRLISRVCEDTKKSETFVVENGCVSAFDGGFEKYHKEHGRDFEDYFSLFD